MTEVEINLAELEEWYMEQLQARFKREHKILSKIFSKSADELAQAKHTLDAWLKAEPNEEDEKLDEKSKKIMERFVENVRQSLLEIKIPTIHSPITYDSCQDLSEGIKKLYLTYNSEGKKALKRFWKQYKVEIKEIDLRLRKLGNYSQKVQKFMLKSYQEAKDAEYLVRKIPLLENNIDRLGSTKVKLDEMETTYAEMKKDLKALEDQLFQISQDEDLKKFEAIEHKVQIAKRDFHEKLKFKKAFKKMKKYLEKGTIALRDINDSDLKPYLKDSVSTILREGPKIPRLRQILIKTRIMLEDEKDYLHLKSELKEKVIENINEIVSNNSLEADIAKILAKENEMAEIRKKLQAKGLESQRNELKEKISISTVDLEHFENDLERYRRDYKDLLSKVKNERAELQDAVKAETEQDVKIKVIIPA